jgi:hypothetical protein
MNLTKDFFLSKGDELFFKNKNKFEEIFPLLNLEVPGRTQGRNKAHRERYTIFNYLKILNHNDKIEFPLTIIKSDSPDFYIETNIKIGIEVTEATDDDLQAAYTQLEKLSSKSGNVILEVPHYKPSKMNKKTSFRGIKQSGQKLDSPGWVGDEIEKYWNEYILRAINNKLSALNDPQKNYKMADMYILLIQDETPTDALDFEKALELSSNLIFDRLNLNGYIRTFGEISIMRSSKLIYDLQSKKAIYGID